MNTSGKLKGKDLINIGIYAAIYCVIMTAVAMLGFIPIMMPMLCVLVPLLGGIPYMLFMTKWTNLECSQYMPSLSGCFCVSQGWDIGHLCLELCLVFLLI